MGKGKHKFKQSPASNRKSGQNKKCMYFFMTVKQSVGFISFCF